MGRRQGYIIVALLAVIAVALVVLVGVLAASAGDDDGATAGQGQPSTSSTDTAVEEPADPAAALEDAGLDVVMRPPVPEAPDAWGDYQLDASWDGQVRVFEGGDATPVEGETGAAFPASQNNCGTEAYFVTFRAVGDGARVDAQLANAVGEPVDSEVLTAGWMLATNCVTPSFAFDSSESGGTLAEVAYSVHRYRQASLAGGTAREVTTTAPVPAPAPSPAPAPAAPAAPTFVECLFGTPGPARFSDGTVRNHQPCRETPEARTSVEAERNCNDANWRRQMQAEGDRFCGSTAWADGFYE